MNANASQRRRRKRAGDGRGAGSCGSRGRGERERRGRSSVKLDAARTLTALGVSVAHDLRDRDGLMRPLLRRAALRLTASRQAPIRRAGDAYLRSDPPTTDELTAGSPPAPAMVLTAHCEGETEPVDSAEPLAIEAATGAGPPPELHELPSQPRRLLPGDGPPV